MSEAVNNSSAPAEAPTLCRKCGKEIPPGSAYCNHCGAKQAARPPYRRRRGNGQGTAIKRGRTWTARVVIGYVPVPDSDPPRKKAVYRTKGGFPTKRDALDFCVRLKEANYTPDRAAPQLIHYWNTYEDGELAKIGKSKQSAYRTAWRKLEDIHFRQVNQITVAELRDVVGRVTSTYYPAKDCKTVLTHLFELAGADGWCSKDLPSYIVLPTLEETEREVFTADEQAALWRLYEAGDLRAAVPLLMICTGIMPGEIQKLRVDQIDLEAHKIYKAGIKTKVRKKSAIYLPEDILPVVEDLISHALPNGYLWTRNEEKWYANYYAALEAAGCRRLEPYSCRHTTATRLAVTEGIAPQTIKRVMRWSTTKMLDRYAHPDDSDVIEAANTIKKAPAEQAQENPENGAKCNPQSGSTVEVPPRKSKENQ